MNEQNTKYLYEKYPKIFADKDKSETETCMCWGFECGDGWFKIIDNLCHCIQQYVNRPTWIPKHPWIFNKVKDLYNRTFWNCIFYPIGHRLFLSKVPKMYPSTEADKYKQAWARFSTWRNILMCDGPAYKAPPFDPNRQVVAEQVKEKFGTLRFYYRGGGQFIDGLVDMAEAMSAHTCETCGSTDDTVHQTTSGWIHTICSSCEQKTKTI